MMAATGTAGALLPSPVAILKVANISALSAPSGLGISERTTTRRVATSEAAPIAAMRALNRRSGRADTLTSMSWPTRADDDHAGGPHRDIGNHDSDSRTWAPIELPATQFGSRRLVIALGPNPGQSRIRDAPSVSRAPMASMQKTHF